MEKTLDRTVLPKRRPERGGSTRGLGLPTFVRSLPCAARYLDDNVSVVSLNGR
jgi:hypothetical protein